MTDKGTIVFTIMKSHRTAIGVQLYAIKSKHARGSEENVDDVYADELFDVMVDLSEVLNDEGYAVIFEVD